MTPDQARRRAEEATPTVKQIYETTGLNVNVAVDAPIVHSVQKLCQAAIAAALVKPTQGQEPVAWCHLTLSGKIGYFDGKPMIMPGPVGNEHHETPLYTHPIPSQQEERVRELEAVLASTRTRLSPLLNDYTASYTAALLREVFATIDAARNKEQGK